MSILFDYWMLPILFILHDFEEIIMVSDWKKRQRTRSFSKNYFGQTSHTAAFSIAVLEEFIILLFLSGISQLSHLSLLYLAVCLAYTSHFLMHYVMCWRFKGYVPGVLSAALQLPVMYLIISHYWQSSWETLFYFLPVFLLTYLNLIMLHKMMAKFEQYLAAYAKR
ncbi:HXXEE domain-containing protein [Streptococcus dentiloxodontae]